MIKRLKSFTDLINKDRYLSQLPNNSETVSDTIKILQSNGFSYPFWIVENVNGVGIIEPLTNKLLIENKLVVLEREAIKL